MKTCPPALPHEKVAFALRDYTPFFSNMGQCVYARVEVSKECYKIAISLNGFRVRIVHRHGIVSGNISRNTRRHNKPRYTYIMYSP